jgi:hypothetical protein
MAGTCGGSSEGDSSRITAQMLEKHSVCFVVCVRGMNLVI